MNVGLIFLGLWFCVLSVFALVGWARHSKFGRASENWNSVKGEILESSVQLDDDGDPFPEIRFRYFVGKQEYQNDQITFEPIKMREPVPTEFVDKYCAGKQVRVFVDPTVPSRSILEPGFSRKSNKFLLTFIVVFFAIGVVMLYFGLAISDA